MIAVLTLMLYWWYLPIVLFLIPIVYCMFRGNQGAYDFGLDLIFIFGTCWSGALFTLIGHFL